jgi:hypothetical protein
MKTLLYFCTKGFLKKIFYWMKKLFLVSCFLCLISQMEAQNLVPNRGFDTISQCPGDVSFIYLAQPWFQPNIYMGNTTNSSSSDLYDTCASASTVGVPLNQLGNQAPRTGRGYAGIMVYVDTTNYREYIEAPLISTLIANRHYCVQYYVSLADVSYNAISDMGAYFSRDSLLSPIYSPAIDSITPQIENLTTNMLSDKINWMVVSGSFIANGGEKFITIGNFHKPANTNAQPVSGGSIYPGMAYYYIDDVSVVDCLDEGVGEISDNGEINIYPNPNEGVFQVSSFKFQIKSIKIFNTLGELVYQSIKNNQQTAIDISKEQKGVYIVAVQTEKEVLNRKIIIE